ncbi:anthranilate synthase component II [Schizosaccharomyces japonicus yFS275]|uniref:Multifunctional tryptophan biosynthesis protein n=1 Tax=Schizosaccharomyces japonicus (strain yFS275 / FY16936) TaxID=402676 RepID=B6JXZ5_SCHJY|nr:anthranilate synthase component II [Schizosaccharomyces japonicus yFS275]EEB06413.1 anthranilate synthase component II [Schizosaccharomyces japonicus yFS275]
MENPKSHTAENEERILPEVEERPIVMIDNYDSFVWNVVQYLSNLEKRYPIIVFRNDEITVDELEKLNPRKLVLSPGPGHPTRDSGICNEAIARFAGKIPIFGVCMGLQCIFHSMGGKVESAGEIIHGKTSKIYHDGLGLYDGIPQGINVIRYHSLAGNVSTLPDSLIITSWTDNGIIMGARHKEYCIEGVQYHPESILSEYGKECMKNFLNLEGGTWAENGIHMPQDNSAYENRDKEHPVEKKESILEKIHKKRLVDVAESKKIPGKSVADLKRYLELGCAPPSIDFVARLRQRKPALMAEVKRASPSKGDINLDANAAAQALAYASAGASVISVLTEPHWFKGSLSDMELARKSVSHLSNRPAILRKDFIFDPYQIMEARLHGADTVLLIVAMLSQGQLESLYSYSKSLGMEPLVEVNCREEMEIALKLGAKAIGVNNRNLHTFQVDLNNTSSMASMVPEDVVLCALSGISSAKDVEKYVEQGVSAVLVGESLMRASDVNSFAKELVGLPNLPNPTLSAPLVKVCGTRSVKAAKCSVEAGADFIGVIFAKGSKREIKLSIAKQISQYLKGAAATAKPKYDTAGRQLGYFQDQLSQYTQTKRPLLVGVFRNQSLEYIRQIDAEVDLDIIQLHGNEPAEWATMLKKPVFRAFSPENKTDIGTPRLHSLPLIDAFVGGQSGGLGTTVDWEAAAKLNVPFILAGGLNPENVKEAIQKTNAAVVDVSSGVETNGEQDLAKIKAFVKNAKGL